MALFGDGAWEDAMQRLTARDDDGKLVDVVLDQEAFRDLISVLE
jgi:predicted Zn-dependent protease